MVENQGQLGNQSPSTGEQVRVCRICGSPNPLNEGNYCNNCWLRLDQPQLAPQDIAQSRFARRGRGLFRRRPLAFIGVVVAVLLVWQILAAWDVTQRVLPSPKPTNSVSAYAGPGGWGQTGRTPENSAYIEEYPPVADTVAWTFSVPPAESSPAPPRLISGPAVGNGRVFLTTEDGRTLALDQASGEVIWEYESGLPSTSTPAVAGGLVVFGARPGQVFALDENSGELRWFADLDSAIVASPIVEDGRVYLGAADNHLYALDAATGNELWRFLADNWVTSQVAQFGDTVVVTTSGKKAYILDAKTGRQRFVYDTGVVRNLYGSAAILDDIAYIPSHRGMLWAVERNTSYQPLEQRFWTARVKMAVWWSLFSPPVQKGTVWVSSLGGRVVRSPAAAHDRIFASVQDGRVVGLDANTGELDWETNLGDRITTSPTVAGGSVLVGTQSGKVAAMNAESGMLEWDFQLADSAISGRPIVSNGMVLVPSRDGNLYALTAGP